MKIGIIETGVPPEPLGEQWGSYASMFEAMLGEGFECEVFDVEPPLPDPASKDGWLLTGSPAGAYDPLPWIAPLEDWLRRNTRPTAGVCFGHQIMAQAHGGKVEKSAKGWGAGLHDYEIGRPAQWMADPSPIRIVVSHQDQVIEPPPNADVLGGSAFTPNGVLQYRDRPAISFQCHPEFSRAFSRALIARDGASMPGPVAQAALSSLESDDDRGRVADWIRAFYRGSKAP